MSITRVGVWLSARLVLPTAVSAAVANPACKTCLRDSPFAPSFIIILLTRHYDSFEAMKPGCYCAASAAKSAVWINTDFGPIEAEWNERPSGGEVCQWNQD